MGFNTINLTIRFLLELASLFVIGLWGWEQSETWIRFILAIGLPLIFAIIWGVFAVPNDPSRSGKTVIATSGIIRLAIELAFFAFAVWALYNLKYASLSWILGVIVAFHYILSYDRVKWLIKQ